MLIDLRKQSVCRDLEKALCEDMLKDFKPKFIILKQERPKIKKKTKYLVNDFSTQAFLFHIWQLFSEPPRSIG